MSQFRVLTMDGTPTVALTSEAGVLGWQDWMCDSVALLGSDAPDQVILFSFATGTVLQTASLTREQRETLGAGSSIALISDDLGEDLRFEGMIFKNEPFEGTGAFFRGIRSQTMGDLAGAITAYHGLTEQFPSLPRVSNLLGLCLRVSQRYPEAEQAYLREIENAPHLPDVYCNLGILYLKTDREHLARTMFEKALERDQFHLNSLLQWSKLLSRTEEQPSRIASSINLRLFAGYPEVSQVQDHLSSLAGRQGMTIQELGAHLRSSGGLLSDPRLLMLMKRVENLRLNGALIASLRGFSHLLKKTTGSALEKFFLHWVSRRIQLICPVIPAFLTEKWDQVIEELFADYPSLPRCLGPDMAEKPDAERDSPSGMAVESPSETALTPEEFFSMVLVEILRDGQIKPEEAKMMLRLKNLLRIDEEAHQRLFSGISSRVRGNPQADDGGEFNAGRLFKQLIIAVLRDGKVEPQEKKLLAIASEALELSHQEVKALIAEVQNR